MILIKLLLGMIINVPARKAYVLSEYLTDGKIKGKTIPCYVIAARVIKSRPILFTVHLENGAVYSGLPVNAITTEEHSGKLFSLQHSQPWSCLESPANAIVIEHLKDYEVEVFSPELLKENEGLSATGTYLYTIDYSGEGLAQDPEQHKCHHIIALESSNWVAMPNNYCWFKDRYFTEKETSVALSELRRSSKYLKTY